jgi:LEA14-like dessication related protein
MQDPFRWASLWGALLVGACTPLGVWVYEDPAVTVARVRLGTDTSAARRPPVEVALDLRNPNDFEMSNTRVELQLRLDDQPIGGLARDSTIALPRAATSTVAVPLVVDRGTSSARLLAFGAGRHRFHVEGRVTFVTPFGRRKVRFAQEGELAFGSAASPGDAPTDPDASP